MQQDQRIKLGTQEKRLQAGWGESYVAELLREPPYSTTGTAGLGDGNISRT